MCYNVHVSYERVGWCKEKTVTVQTLKLLNAFLCDHQIDKLTYSLYQETFKYGYSLEQMHLYTLYEHIYASWVGVIRRGLPPALHQSCMF